MIPLLTLDQLPRQNATQVKNKWGDVVRQVHQSGSLAITSHASVEMVLLDAATYQEITQQINALQQREQSALDELQARFNARLEVLQSPDAANKLSALLEAKGNMPSRPKAGSAY